MEATPSNQAKPRTPAKCFGGGQLTIKNDQDTSINQQTSLCAVKALAACQLGFQWTATRTQYEQGAVFASKQLEAQPIKVCRQQGFFLARTLLDVYSQFSCYLWSVCFSKKEPVSTFPLFLFQQQRSHHCQITPSTAMNQLPVRAKSKWESRLKDFSQGCPMMFYCNRIEKANFLATIRL